MSTRTKGIVGLLALATLSVALVITPPEPAGGQAGKAEFKLKLMGINRTLDPWKLFAEWAQTVEKRTSGACSSS